MTEQIPPKAIERFEHLQRLFNNSGSLQGERENAKRMMDKLRRQYPNIEFYVRGEEEQTRARFNPESETRDWSDLYKEQQSENRFKWREWMGWAAGFADKAFGIREAQLIGETAKITIRNNKNGSLTASVKLDEREVRRVTQFFTEEQKVILCNTLAQQLAQELLDKLTD
jgi:hypothetical protein